MALIKIEPYIIDATGDFTFNNVTATGNLSSLNANLGNLATANYFSGSGANLTNLPAGNISGQVANALVAGTVYTAAQPNITSVGTLTGLTSTGTADLTGASNVALGPVANVHITGGSSGQYLQTDGSGTLSWSTVSSGSTSNISNGNSNVNIPSANGNINLTAVGNTTMVITGTGVNIAGTLNTTGNTTVGNLFSSGSGGNISNVNVISANTFIASGNVTAGNIVTSGSGGNISNANVISANTFTASGNITAGNANLGNLVTANFFSGNGSLLTGITVSAGNSIVNGNSNVTVTANGNVTTSVAGNANILIVTGTGVNVAGTLNVSGNTTVSNLISSGTGGNISNANVISANTFIASGDITATNINTTGSGGNIGNANVISANTFIASGNITAGNANLGNNVTANFFTGNGIYLTGITTAGLSNGNSNVNIPSANGNVNISAVGNANILVVTGTGANITGTANVSGNITTGPHVIAQGTSNVVNFSSQALLVRANNGNNSSVMGIMNEVANAYSIITFNNNAAAEVGAVGFANPSAVYFANSAYLYAANNTNGIVLSANIGAAPGNKNLWITNAGLVTVPGSTAATSTTTGAFQVTGGVGIGGNVYAGNANITGTANITGNIIGANLMGPLANGNSNVRIATSNGNINLTAVGNTVMVVTGTGANIAGYANVTGNVNATYFIGNGAFLTGVDTSPSNISNGTSNVQVNSSGNVTTSVAGNANIVVVTGTGANINGTLRVTGNSNIANLGATGNISASYFIGNGSLLTGVDISPANISNGTSNVNISSSNGNVTVSVGGIANVVVFTGTGVNISGYTSITGNITANYFTGNISATSSANLGSVSNVTITGGTNGYVLSTNGSGNLSWVAQSGGSGSPGGSNTQIQYNNGGSFGGSAALTFNDVSNILTITNLNMSGTSNLGPVGNVTITGGTTGYVLSTDGTGNLSWVAQSGGGGGGGNTISNGNSSVAIPTANGNINLTAVGNTTMVVTGTGANIAGTLNVSGPITGSIVPKVVTIADGTSVTINADTTELAIQTNTQAAGTLTINAPTGTLSQGQKIMFRLQSSNVQTFSWNAIFNGSTDLNLPTVSSGSNKYDYVGFIYNSTASKWNIIAKNFGF